MTSPFVTQGPTAAMEQKARDLGRLIGQSAEHQAFKRASDSLKADRDAVAALNRMTELRMQAQSMIERGQEPSSEMERELDELLGKVQVLPAYQHMIVAQENYEKSMVQVNDWIAEGIKAGATSSIITLG